jgi:methanethiol S-methyltransferase
LSRIAVVPTHQVHASSTDSPVWRIVFFVYGLVAYAGFLAVVLYAIGFLGNWLVPKSVDSGVSGPIIPSLAINAALLMVFVLQHTIMARPGFKRWITQWMPRSIERSTFVLAADLSLALLFWQWRPLTQVVWDAGPGWPTWLLSALSLAGWGLVVLASCMVSHADLFGLRQVWFNLVNRPYAPVGFRLFGLYRLVRHPLMLGFLIAFWSTPVMTLGHLAFAALGTLYIFMGVWFEERDLIAEHGEKYLDYRRRVRGLIPLPRATTN